MTHDDQPAGRVINDAAEDPRLTNGQKKKAAAAGLMHRFYSWGEIDEKKNGEGKFSLQLFYKVEVMRCNKKPEIRRQCLTEGVCRLMCQRGRPSVDQKHPKVSAFCSLRSAA